MKEIFAAVINRGNYDLFTLIRKISECNVAGEISDRDKDELIAKARGEAVPDMDIKTEIQQLWAVINEMDKRVKTLEGGASEDSGTAAEYVQPTGAHDAYYHGAVVSYKGKVYRCIAPSGVACVWPPDVMPSYWEEA